MRRTHVAAAIAATALALVGVNASGDDTDKSASLKCRIIDTHEVKSGEVMSSIALDQIRAQGVTKIPSGSIDLLIQDYVTQIQIANQLNTPQIHGGQLLMIPDIRQDC